MIFKNNPAHEKTSAEEDLNKIRGHLEIAKRELQKLERMKPLASSAAVVVHDVRNSLGVIQSTAQFVLKKLKPSDQEKKAWELVERNVETIKKILKSYLGLARQAEGRKESSSINDIVERVAHFMEAQAKKSGVNVVISLNPSVPKIHLDESSIESAVLNLAINAIEAMDKGGSLTFTTLAKDGKWLILEIEDTGPGISKDLQENLFMPFFTTKADGTGMGLYSAKAILNQNGGDIQAESRPGSTRMILSFPIGGRDS